MGNEIKESDVTIIENNTDSNDLTEYTIKRDSEQAVRTLVPVTFAGMLRLLRKYYRYNYLLTGLFF